jgi:hypothetical protein
VSKHQGDLSNAARECMMWYGMESFLAGSLFRLFVFPIVSVVLGIYIKYVTRNDQFAKFSKEDIAVGFDLMRAAFLG